MKNNNKIGVIIGRFQTPELHPGHIYLLNTVKANHSQNLILLGVSPVKASDRNPLSYNDRLMMVQALEIFDKEETFYAPLFDTKEDEAWSQQIDSIIATSFGVEAEAVVYGGRDSSLSYYSGKHETFQIPDLPEYQEYSATAVREALKTNFKHNVDYRSGRILAYNDMFPIMYSTVDAIIYSYKTNEILLGRKPNETQFRLIGGFVDVTDNTREDAIIREVKEETQLEIQQPIYLFSQKVDDWRYRRERDKIMTDVFLCEVNNFDAAVASDDLAEEKGGELKVFDVFDLSTDLLIDTHRPLFNRFKHSFIRS